MIRETVHALAACVVTFAICVVAYPAAVWGVAWLAFPDQAAGSLIERDGKVIGSELIAQPFASDIYFFPRPSAVDYKADATGGSNLGTKNPDLRKKVAERAEALKATDKNPAPVELVTASGGGLDPHITPEGAQYQAPRVAEARKAPIEKIRALIDRHVDRSGAFIGAPARVNVLKLNLALDTEIPAPAKTASEAPKPETASAPASTPAKADDAAAAPAKAAAAATPLASEDLTAVRAELKSLSEQVARLGKHVESIPSTEKGETAVKELEKRLAGLSDDYAKVSPLQAHVGTLDDRVKAADETARSLRSEIAEVRETLKALRDKAVAVPSLERSAPAIAPEPALASGLDPFRKGRYADAAVAFRTLTKSHPDDARAWYLAAVANGLSTNAWTGETEQMVNKGVEREQAGSPATAEIDAALSVLTKATGGEWLSFYRQRAKR